MTISYSDAAPTAAILRVTVETVRNWVRGYNYPPPPQLYWIRIAATCHPDNEVLEWLARGERRPATVLTIESTADALFDMQRNIRRRIRENDAFTGVRLEAFCAFAVGHDIVPPWGHVLAAVR